MIKLKDILKEWSAVDPGPKRWFKSVNDKYTEYEKATNKSLKEVTPTRGFSNTVSEETIQQGLSKLPGLDSYYIDVSERDTGEWRIQFRRTRRELPSAHWNTAIKFVKSIGGKIDKKWTLEKARDIVDNPDTSDAVKLRALENFMKIQSMYPKEKKNESLLLGQAFTGFSKEEILEMSNMKLIDDGKKED